MGDIGCFLNHFTVEHSIHDRVFQGSTKYILYLTLKICARLFECGAIILSANTQFRNEIHTHVVKHIDLNNNARTLNRNRINI